MPVTIRDVAKQLNLSVTTVSRALDGYDDVAEKTRVRVVEMAEKLGYVPRYAARQLRMQRTETIGLVFPTLGARFSDPFFSEFVAGVGDEAGRQNHDLLVSVAPEGEAEQNTYKRMVASRRVDGFILVRIRIKDWRIQYLVEEGFPFVSFGKNQTHPDTPHIGVDGSSGVYNLVEHLVEVGHRRIAFIGAPAGLTLSHDRLSGYRDGLQAAGIEIDADLIINGNLTQTGGYQITTGLLNLENPPTAIIGANDLTAFGAMRAVQEAGKQVGKDIAIAGFDGTEASEHSLPPLTTLHQPVYEIGRQVCSMLLNLILGEPDSQQNIELIPTLIIRESTLNSHELR